MSEHDLTRLAYELTGGKQPWDVGLSDVCSSARDIVGMSATSVLLVSGLARGITAGSNAWVESLEELQVVLGEGPAFDAVRGGRPVLVADVAMEQPRWPNLVPRLLEGCVEAIFAFPLSLGLVPLGVLTLYRFERGPLSFEQRKRVPRLADAIVEIVLAAQAHENALSGVAAPIDALVTGRIAVDQAVGIIAAQLDSDVAEAAVRLRAYAYAHELSLDSVARAVIDRQLRFER